MPQLTKSNAVSGDISQVKSSDASLSSVQNKSDVFTYDEVFGEVQTDWISLKDALAILEISELEFRKQAQSVGFCSEDEFDNHKSFPAELIDKLDSEHWRSVN